LAEFLPRLHLNYEIVGDWRLIEQDVRSPLLIIEHPRALTDAEIDAVIRFAESGGQVLMTGMGITLRENLPKRFGLKLVRRPATAEPLEVRIGEHVTKLDHHLFRFAPDGCTVLARAVDREGKESPLLTRHTLGRGTLWAVTIPFFSKHGPNTPPLELVRRVMEIVLPGTGRHMVTEAPEDVEVVLRRHRDGALIYHVVNMALGRRTTCPTGHGPAVTIHEIPPIPAHRVSVRVPAKPSSVTIEPGGKAVADWAFREGVVTFTMPATEVHAMAVIRVDGTSGMP